MRMPASWVWILQRVPRIQGCGAIIRAQWRAPLGRLETEYKEQITHYKSRLTKISPYKVERSKRLLAEQADARQVDRRNVNEPRRACQLSAKTWRRILV